MRTAISTIDNPFNPFVQFDEWYAFDESRGYHSTALLARVARSSDEMSEAQQEEAIEAAVDEICEFNDIGLYIKVTEND